MNTRLNFIDLFCGAGGLSNGLSKAGLNCLMGIDFLEPAIDTFKQNHVGSIGICEDLRSLKIEEIKKTVKEQKVHLICGGPPCQGFSTIGTNDVKDARNHLFMEYVKFVEIFNPEYILIENVTGLLSLKNRNTLLSIFNIFKDLGYHLDIRVLSAHHYGVPQARRRVIIIGNNQEKINLYPEKEFNNPNEAIDSYKPTRTVGWAFENLIMHEEKAYNHDLETTVIKKELEEERIQHVPEGKSVRYERDEKKYLPKELWFKHDWNEISEKRFREAKLVRLDRSKPSPTIVTDRRRYYHPIENRYLTVREAAALQSFPASFIFSGSLTKQWVQIGNAVPPIMAEAIGKCINMMHNSDSSENNINKIFDIDLIRSVAFKYSKDTSQVNSLLSQISLDI